jgi:hypothetical protein
MLLELPCYPMSYVLMMFTIRLVQGHRVPLYGVHRLLFQEEALENLAARHDIELEEPGSPKSDVNVSVPSALSKSQNDGSGSAER